MSLRLVRSPDAPNRTRMHGPAAATPGTASGLLAAGLAARLAASFAAPTDDIPLLLRSCRCVRRLDVAAESMAHCRENFFGERVVLARAETRVQRCGQHVGRHGLLDGRLHGPAPFAR